MRGGDNRPRETRVNERIRAREVRVIDDDGQMLGVMTPQAALAMARERNLDLVEVSPMAMPPVCKLMDWGRFKYEQSKKEHEARKHQKVTQLREIRMKPRTDDHDIEVKVRKIQEFLAEGDKIKVSVIFRGRELAHPDLGRVLLDQVTEQLKGTGIIERTPLMEGKMMSMIVSRAPGYDPKKQSGAAAKAQPADSAQVARPAATPPPGAAPAPVAVATPAAAAPAPAESVPAPEVAPSAPAANGAAHPATPAPASTAQ
jgi:translation initiation factor IF-3